MVIRVSSSSNDDDLPIPPLRVATELVRAGAGLPQLLLVTQDTSWTRGRSGREDKGDIEMCIVHIIIINYILFL